MATIYEVSALAGVSLSTVSRVMNNHEHVSEKTKKKVGEAMEQLGYRPNSIARSLASSRSNSIGVMVSELYGPFYGDMLSGIESELRTSEKHAIIIAGHSDENSEKEGINFLRARNCDALILHVDSVSDDYLIELNKAIPIVLINRYIEAIADNCICLNNELGVYLSTKHLLEKGHTDIAYISGPFWKQDSIERYAGYQRALREFNVLQRDELVYEGDYEVLGGRAGMDHLIEQGVKFTSVVCANDEMASGAMKTAREKKIDVPSECSIIGFDNVFFTEYLHPQLSTVDYPIHDMGQMAARWVLKNTYQKEGLELNTLFEPKLILRESTQTISI